jgi:glycosyltransferase involved in cell wall biosynthesis
MANKQGVLFVVNDLRPGGAEMFLLRLAQFLSDDLEIFIHCVNPEKNDPAFVQLFQEQLSFRFIQQPLLNQKRETLFWKINAFFYFLGIKGVFSKLKKNNEILFFKKQLKHYNVRAILTSGISSDFKSTQFFRLHFQLPVILTMHSDYNEEFWNIPGRNQDAFFNLTNQIFKDTDVLFYTADHNIKIFDHLQLKANLPIQKCYLGFQKKSPSNIRPLFNIPKDAFVGTMMARGIPEKGWEEGIQAFTKLQQTVPNSYLLLIHTESEYIDGLREEFKHCSSIIFCGYVSDPSGILYSSDVFLFPSHFPESLPYAITEALACGVPVLSTPIAEIPEMLNTQGDIAGELISFDSRGRCNVDELANKLQLYALDSVLLSEKKNLASMAFEKFDMNTCGNRFKESLVPFLK